MMMTNNDILNRWDPTVWQHATNSFKEFMAFKLTNKLIVSGCLISDVQRQNVRAALSVMENVFVVAMWMRVSAVFDDDIEKITPAYDLFIDDVMACYGIAMPNSPRIVAPRTAFTQADAMVFDDQGSLHKVNLDFHAARV